jgi:hypothetical protein
MFRLLSPTRCINKRKYSTIFINSKLDNFYTNFGNYNQNKSSNDHDTFHIQKDLWEKAISSLNYFENE